MSATAPIRALCHLPALAALLLTARDGLAGSSAYATCGLVASGAPGLAAIALRERLSNFSGIAIASVPPALATVLAGLLTGDPKLLSAGLLWIAGMQALWYGYPQRGARPTRTSSAGIDEDAAEGV